MRSEKQKLLNTFVMTESEANRHFLAACPGKTEEGMNRFKRHLRNQPVGAAKNRVIIFLFFLIFFSASFGGGASEAIGATYYVKNGGNDSLAGTSDAAAWAHAPGMSSCTGICAKTVINNGDIIYLRSQDTWTGAPGSSFRAAVLEAKEGAIYDGKSYGNGTRATLIASGNYVSFYIVGVINVEKSNVVIRGFNVNGGDYQIGGIWVGSHPVANVDNVLVDDCKIHDTKGCYGRGFFVGPTMYNIKVSNITLQNSEIYNIHEQGGVAIYPAWSYSGAKAENITIRNCTIRDTGDINNTTGSYGIYIKDEVVNSTIEYNSVYNNKLGIVLATVADKRINVPTGLTLRYNLIHRNRLYGLDVVNTGNRTFDFSFYGNILYENGSSSTTGGLSDILFSAANYGTSVINIYNNTIYSTDNNAINYPCAVHLGNYGGGTGVTGTPTINFKNNVIYTENYAAIWDINDVLIHSNNLIYRGGGDGHWVKIGNNLNSTYYGGKGNGDVVIWELSSQTVDPIFVGGTLPTGFTETSGDGMIPNTNYFTVTSGNAVYNGSTLGSPYNGCINWTGSVEVACRPAGAYDIGAYQTSTVVAPVPRTKVSRLSQK